MNNNEILVNSNELFINSIEVVWDDLSFQRYH